MSNANNAIQARLDAFRGQRRVQAGSLIVSVFGDAVLPRGGRIWLGSLIRMLESLDLNERLIRTSVFRLVKDEWLQAETDGRRANYVLTASGRRRFDEAARHIYASDAPVWDRRWRLVLMVGDLEAKQREHVRRALFWQGFGVLGAECFVHPSADLPRVFDALVSEGLSSCLGALLPLFAADARSTRSASDADLVSRAWDLSVLADSYGQFLATYQPILEVMRHDAAGDCSEQDAFLLRILLIHDYRRLLLRDPELPEMLLPRDWPGQRSRLLCKELYRRLERRSRVYLEGAFCVADGTLPPEDPDVPERFAQSDPLAAPDLQLSPA